MKDIFLSLNFLTTLFNTTYKIFLQIQASLTVQQVQQWLAVVAEQICQLFDYVKDELGSQQIQDFFGGIINVAQRGWDHLQYQLVHFKPRDLAAQLGTYFTTYEGAYMKSVDDILIIQVVCICFFTSYETRTNILHGRFGSWNFTGLLRWLELGPIDAPHASNEGNSLSTLHWN